MLLELSDNMMNESIFQSLQLHAEDMIFDLEQDDAFNTALCEICDEVKKSCKKMTAKQVKVLSI